MRSRHTRWPRDWSSAACFSDLKGHELLAEWKAKEWLRVLLRKMSMVSTVMPAVKKSSSYMGPSVSFIVTIVWNRKIGKIGRASCRESTAAECYRVAEQRVEEKR